MRWFFPAWNGDFRLEPIEEDPAVASESDASAAVPYRTPDRKPKGPRCKLIILKPTAGEREHLTRFLKIAHEKSWTSETVVSDADESEIVLTVSVADAGQELVRIIKPTDRTITAVTFRDGKVQVAESASPAELKKLAAEAEKKKAKAAVSVARPTPCCPDCTPGAIEPATEVLLSFLDPEQHEQWARDRSIVTHGGITGHRYLIAHRHSRAAERITRVCYDLDDRCVVHFHQHDVPPEEEVLAAKLILEHREPWLRNEATMFHGRGTDVFKNPFGDVMDGTEDATFTRQIGGFVKGFMMVREAQDAVLGVRGPKS